ncbi:hypothetical protein AEAC466_20550 [Asticcacaulis sp. AC466]|uniref:serine hydrolase domain-containing protein n=1 Tax=Asticcacaulis sp. AC466 TaxID=1282362 RepID=UPI0003C3C2E7|nr:serine hydrolase domain-containing protein [Asticcacaulis sp. AC466]ESQ81688.1 hypothetical protein AEAC466_20550 [Asticcacaulis sp. AC466]
MSRRACLGGLAAAAALTPASIWAASTNVIDRLSLDGAPGLAAGVVRKGQVKATGGKGIATLGSKTAPDRNTIFEIGSLTKTFTACLIFQLQEEGRLSIEAPIGTYVTDLPKAWQGLPLSQLLSHTAGLPNYLNGENFRAIMPQDLKPRQLIAMVADQPLVFTPGERHEYSNTGFILLGMAAEAITGTDYWDTLQTRFFGPAGMTSTGPRNRVKTGTRLASGHFWDGTAYDTAPPRAAPGSTWAAGGLLSSVADIDRWSIALDEGRILTPALRQKMWRPATLNNGSPAGWGYGWQVELIDGRTIVSHGGSTAGFSCWYRRDLSQTLSTIVMTNQNGLADPKAMTEALLTYKL